MSGEIYTQIVELKQNAMDLARAEQQCRELRQKVDSIEREIYQRLREMEANAKEEFKP